MTWQQTVVLVLSGEAMVMESMKTSTATRTETMTLLALVPPSSMIDAAISTNCTV